MQKKSRFIQQKKNHKAAFTLIEMLIVLVVVALLMAIIIPNVAGQKDRIDAQATENIRDIIETQVNTYLLVEQDDDVTLSELSASGYITDKQLTEAVSKLSLDAEAEITLPITISSTPIE